MGSFWTKSYGFWMQPCQPSRTFTWNTSSLPPILNCDSNKMVNFSSVTDSAPRRSDRLILFKDCRDIMRENEQNYTHTINIQGWTHLSLISVTRWEVNNAFGMGGGWWCLQRVILQAGSSKPCRGDMLEAAQCGLFKKDSIYLIYFSTH